MSNAIQTLDRPVNNAVINPADYDHYNVYSDDAAENSHRSIVGKLLKFAKGDWSFGKNDAAMPIGTKMAVDMRTASVGWVRWADGKPVEHRINLLTARVRLETRDQLGFNDKSQWEVDNQGVPKDPWQLTRAVIMSDDSGTVYTFTPSSVGGRNCLINLGKAYGAEGRQHPGQEPVVKIGNDSWPHPKHKKIWVPTMAIVGWIERTDLDQIFAAERAEVSAAAEAADPAPVRAAPVRAAPVRTVPPKEASAPAAPAAAPSSFGFKKPAAASSAPPSDDRLTGTKF